jgi:hypothetical protein
MKACVEQELSGPSGMTHVDVPDGTPGVGDMRAAGVFGMLVLEP